MPQLPSGRHVAITLAPLSHLFDRIKEEGSLERILAIEDVECLYPYTEVLYLRPPQGLEDVGLDQEFVAGSLPRPENMIQVSSGCTVAEWDKLTAEWDVNDKCTFREFLSGRGSDLLRDGMEEVERIRKVVNENQQKRMKAFMEAWQQIGQEEEWLEDLDTPDWDDYDMLAALGLAVAFGAANHDVYGLHQNAFDRATGMWSMLAGHYAFLQQPIAVDGRAKDLSRQWREQDALATLPEERQTWLHKQLVIECANLWNHAGEALETECPSAYGILTLVTLSPEGTAAS